MRRRPWLRFGWWIDHQEDITLINPCCAALRALGSAQAGSHVTEVIEDAIAALARPETPGHGGIPFPTRGASARARSHSRDRCRRSCVF